MIADPLAALATILGRAEEVAGGPTVSSHDWSGQDWAAVLDVAAAHDLVPALWSAARRVGLVEPVPAALVEPLGHPDADRNHPAAVLELAHRRNDARNRDLLDQLSEVAAELTGAGLSVVALKGAAQVVVGTWPDPADRVMSDLDLLVPAGQAPDALDRLDRLGYVADPHPHPVGHGHHHLAPRHRPGRFGAVEVHVAPLQRGWRAALGTDELLARASIPGWRGTGLAVPAPEHLALIALVHADLADGARYRARVPLRAVHELWCLDRRVVAVAWHEVRAGLAAIGWSSLVDDLAVAVGDLLGDQGWADRVSGSVSVSASARRRSRARLALAAQLRRRPGLDRVVQPGLRVRHAFDTGRLQRHHGTGWGSGWRLRAHHVAAGLGMGRSEPPITVRRALLVVPEVPALGGNGLAMRAGILLSALAEVAEVTLVVWRPPDAAEPTPAELAWAASRVERLVVHRPDRLDDSMVARSWLATPDGRTRLAALEPLAPSIRLAHPEAVEALVARLGAGDRRGFDLVVAHRLRSAPWVGPFLDGPGVVVVDLDDDEVGTHRRLAAVAAARGEEELAATLASEAEGLARLADLEVPRFDQVWVASPDEAGEVERHRPRSVAVVPNAVEVPRPASRSSSADPVRVLFVGNLAYAPNRWAAEDLVEQVRPTLADLLGRRLGRPLVVELVGPAPAALRALAGADEHGRVEVAGKVDDLTEVYARADLVAIPLVVGGGTRLKALEAFAHGVPVVSTTTGVAGLGVTSGLEAVVVPDGDWVAFAEAAADLLVDLLAGPGRRAAPVVAARVLVDTGFTRSAVVTDLARALAPAHDVFRR